MANIREISLVDLLPPNLAQDPKVKAVAEALDDELRAVTRLVDQCLIISRIDELTEDVLDLLAWQFHVDFYEPDIPLQQKRDLVKKSISWHKRKGTPSTVEELLSAIFSPTIVEEWWEYDGEPYHFRVFVGVKDGLEYEKIISSINAVKNKRSVLDALIPLFTTTLLIKTSFNRWLSDILKRCGTINTAEEEIISTLGRHYDCFFSEIEQHWLSELLLRASESTYPTANGVTYSAVLTESKATYFSIELLQASEVTYCGEEVYA